MPENLSRIILAIGAKEGYKKSWYISEVDVINDIEAEAMPKLFIFPISNLSSSSTSDENTLFVPVSVDTDWSSYTFRFGGTYRSEEAARRNSSGLIGSQKFGRTSRWILGGLTLGVIELGYNFISAVSSKRGGYVLDSFAYWTIE